MTASLSTLTSQLQALLLDNGTLFTTATCTAAIRQALNKINQRLPVYGGTLIDIVSGQYEYELTDALAGATPIMLTDVLLQDPALKQYDVSLSFDQWVEDERWFLRLHTPQGSGHLIVRFSQAHTISGLDSATESTLPALYDPVVLDGAAAQACLMASAGKIEANNLDPFTSSNYANAAVKFEAAFLIGLEQLSIRRRPQKSVPDTRAWDDKYHNWPNLQ